MSCQKASPPLEWQHQHKLPGIHVHFKEISILNKLLELNFGSDEYSSVWLIIIYTTFFPFSYNTVTGK